MTLPLYGDFNYTLTRESLETRREFQESEGGRFSTGWEILVPPPGPDGVPYQLIFVGPTSEHRGCALRLCLVDAQGGAVDDDAEVLLETYYKTGEERTVMFQGRYGDFNQVPDQRAAEAAVGLQKRAESGEDYVIRLGVTLPEGQPPPDLEANDSYFELDCVKLWWNETA
ncbi:MAG: hypothetical protein BZY88_01360 [SAR202 cluster bacterium Io17-Chloro-G9]|nr:MAG: hypothetical protein BZY88_01360 [SAR202 cluster bacterium Io17-Chloro-G9]